MKAHPLADLFPMLSGQSFTELVDDIRANGLREPIWTFEDQILDGRNRYRACLEASVTPQVRPYTGPDPLGFVLSLNLHRRHLNPGQLALLALRIEELEAKEAKKRQIRKPADSVVPNLAPQTADAGKASEKAAVVVGCSPSQVRKAKKLKKSRPDLAKKVDDGELSLHAAERKADEENRVVELQRPVKIDLHPGLHRGDFRELTAQIADESVELVFTDPPYDGESAHLYEDAARVAARILKPGGSFIAYSGQRHLPTVLAGCSRHLTYWWTIAGVHSGGNQLLQKLGIRCGWKPLVWFVKGTRGDVQNILVDVVTGDREKDAHQWQQAESEAMYYIEHLTSPTGLVVDFFLGGGTTAVAAKKLGRPWIGFEVDATAAETASTRIGKAA